MPSRLVREAVGVKQLHQLPPKLAQFGGFLGGEFLFLRHRRRLIVIPLLLRAGLPVFLLDPRGVFLPVPDEEIHVLPAVVDDGAQPVAPLEMLAQPGKQPGRQCIHLRLFDREARFQFRQPRLAVRRVNRICNKT